MILASGNAAYSSLRALLRFALAESFFGVAINE
jgi:hypothetical protein